MLLLHFIGDSCVSKLTNFNFIVKSKVSSIHPDLTSANPSEENVNLTSVVSYRGSNMGHSLTGRPVWLSLRGNSEVTQNVPLINLTENLCCNK